MEAVFLRRFVEGVSRNDDALSICALQDHDLDDFAGYSDAETVSALLCEKQETSRDVRKRISSWTIPIIK
jgi:hypothetical protein